MMTPDADSLLVEGPIVHAEVSDPDRPQETALDVGLLVDTGADLTILPRSVVDALGRRRTREVRLASAFPGSVGRCPMYEVILHIAGASFEAEVGALPRDDSGLLGRDLLAHLRFTYDGPSGRFSLVAPTA